jgi:hypothetical protein
MPYRVSIQSPLNYSANDKPIFEGSLTKNGVDVTATDLIFATVRSMATNRENIISESLVTYSGTTFTFVVQSLLFRTEEGYVQIAAYEEDTTVTATLNGAHTINTTTLTLTVSSGSLPDSGWLIVGSEAMSFEKLSATELTVDRSVFNTTASAYSGGETVSISQARETAIPPYPLYIETDYDKVKGGV